MEPAGRRVLLLFLRLLPTSKCATGVANHPHAMAPIANSNTVKWNADVNNDLPAVCDSEGSILDAQLEALKQNLASQLQ